MVEQCILYKTLNMIFHYYLVTCVAIKTNCHLTTVALMVLVMPPVCLSDFLFVISILNVLYNIFRYILPPPLSKCDSLRF